MSNKFAWVLLLAGIAAELLFLRIFFTFPGGEDTIGLYLLIMLVGIPAVIISVSTGAIKLFPPTILAFAGAVICISSLLPIYFKAELIKNYHIYNTIPFTIFFALGIILFIGSIFKFFLKKRTN